MRNKPFENRSMYENDIEDLIIPYQLVSKTDREVIETKYMKLRKTSYGYIVRLGILSPQ